MENDEKHVKNIIFLVSAFPTLPAKQIFLALALSVKFVCLSRWRRQELRNILLRFCSKFVKNQQ